MQTNTQRRVEDGRRNDSAAVAAVGSTQANGARITTSVAIVTGANATKAVVLPPARLGRTCTVVNKDDAVLVVFPSSGDNVINVAADTAYSQAAKTVIQYIAENDTQWSMLIGAAQY